MRPKPTTAFLGSWYVGTDRLGRPLTDEESRDLAKHLRAYDFVGACLVSLRYAFTLRRNKAAAQDLQGRANLRLIRQGWDWRIVTLVSCMCRFVWSEHHNMKSETAAARRAEEVFLQEEAIHQGGTTPSAETEALRIEAERKQDVIAKARIETLRAAFTAADDQVNLLWLDYRLEDITDLGEMARKSKRPIEDFYRAAVRRKRHATRLVDVVPADPGAPSNDKEKT